MKFRQPHKMSMQAPNVPTTIYNVKLVGNQPMQSVYSDQNHMSALSKSNSAH